MSMNDLSVKAFAEELAAKVSVPGGGGAAALVGALAAALGSMVGVFTVGKPKYQAVEEDIKALLEKAETLRVELLNCIDEDAVGFEPLSRAYNIPKDEPGRDETLEKCLRDAAAVPMKITELSCQVIELQKEFAEKGSTLMISDAGCGAVLAWAAMYAAVLNVRVNTKLMKDRAYAEEMNARTDELMNKYWKVADQVYESVFEKLK